MGANETLSTDLPHRRLDDMPPWMLGVLGALVCFVVYLPTATWDHAQVNDARATVVGAWSLAHHGSIQVDTDWPDVPWAREGPDGSYYVWRHPGGIVWSALFYLPTNLAFEPSAAIEVPHAPATVSGVLATALGIGIMILVLRRLVPAPIALWAGLILAFGTGNWSVSADGPWNHGPTLLFLALGLYASASERHAGAGLAFAAAITIRPHVAVAPAALGLAASWRRRSPKPALVVGLISLTGLAAVVWFYGHFFGTPTIRPDQTSAFISGDVNLTDHGWGMNILLFLVDMRRGLFVYSPFLLLLLPAVPAAWRTAPSWVRASAIGGLAYAAIQTRADVYHAGPGFFGYRGPLEMLTLVAPLLVIAYHERIRAHLRWRTAVVATALASVAIFAAGELFLDPRLDFPAHCDVQHRVADYRPAEERRQGLRDVVRLCHGRDPDDIPAELYERQLSP